MGDIDFNELDKAVTSLMGSMGPKVDKEEPRTLEISDTLQPDEKPPYEKLDEAVKKISSQMGTKPTAVPPAPKPADTPPSAEAARLEEKVMEAIKPRVPTPSAPRPSSGRFMDVVHPSSDMRSSPAPLPPLVVPARENPAPQVPEFEAKVPAPIEQPVLPVDVEDAPLTPFLPDANTKVEKRPLGGSLFPEKFDESEPKEPVETQPINGDFSKTNEINPVEEKGQNQRTLNPTDFGSGVSPEERNLQSIESATVADASPDEESVRAVESGDTGKLRSGNRLSTADTTGAIYDPQEYSQPLAHPPKQKSGWGTVVIIVVIIIICIAAAAGAYFVLGQGS